MAAFSGRAPLELFQKANGGKGKEAGESHNGPVGSDDGVQESDCYCKEGLVVGTLEGHTLGATLQGSLWK